MKVKQIRHTIVILISGSHWFKNVIIENIPTTLLEVIEFSFWKQSYKWKFIQTRQPRCPQKWTLKILFGFGFVEVSKTDLCELKKRWGNVFQLLHFWNQWLPLIKMMYSVPYLFDFHPKITSCMKRANSLVGFGPPHFPVLSSNRLCVPNALYCKFWIPREFPWWFRPSPFSCVIISQDRVHGISVLPRVLNCQATGSPLVVLALPIFLCYHPTEPHLTFDMGFLIIILHVGKSGGWWLRQLCKNVYKRNTCANVIFTCVQSHFI